MSIISADGWPDDAGQLREQLKTAGLGEDAVAALAGAARPALGVSATVADDASISVGATKFGGLPDLPAGVAWPRRPAYPTGPEHAENLREQAASLLVAAGVAPHWLPPAKAKRLGEQYQRAEERSRKELLKEQDKLRREIARGKYSAEELEEVSLYLADDFMPPAPTAEEAGPEAARMLAIADSMVREAPLVFIGQFDLGELSKRKGFDPLLPTSGRLYIFYDLAVLPSSLEPESGIALRILYDSSPVSELTRAELPEGFGDIGGLKAAHIACVDVVTAPPAFSTAAPLKGKARERYDDWLLEVVGWPGEPHLRRHQLGGWPRAIQENMFDIAQLASNGVDAGSSDAWRGKKNKTLLANADAWRLIFQLGEDVELGNHLPGGLNFLLREEDLVNRRFDRAWAVYEQS